MREEIRCRHYLGYSFRLATRVLLYALPTEHYQRSYFSFQPVLQREREMFYLTTHSTHFIYGYMASDIWLRTILIVRKETRCRHIGYSYRLVARVLLYAPSHRQNTYHGLCYTSRGALAGTRNSSSQCSMTGVTKAVVCVILSVGWCI